VGGGGSLSPREREIQRERFLKGASGKVKGYLFVHKKDTTELLNIDLKYIFAH